MIIYQYTTRRQLFLQKHASIFNTRHTMQIRRKVALIGCKNDKLQAVYNIKLQTQTQTQSLEHDLAATGSIAEIEEKAGLASILLR